MEIMFFIGLEIVTNPFSGWQSYSKIFFFEWSITWHSWILLFLEVFEYSENYSWEFMQAISWSYNIPFLTPSLNLKKLDKEEK